MISKEKREELVAKIEPLRQQIETWRQSRPPGQRMPEALWEAATQLAKEFGFSPVQGILRIDYRGLEYRATGVNKSTSAKVAPPIKTTFVKLSYKTERGAKVGDLFMSLVQTCRLNRINPFKYLLELVRHASEVKAEPARWLPWNFPQPEINNSPPASDTG